MKRREFAASVAMAVAMPGSSVGQTGKRVARVGWIGWRGNTSPVPSVPLEALREGLAELGWRERDNLVLEVREGDRGQAATLAAELMHTGVEVIVAVGPMVFAARAQAGNVPVVFNINGDPIEAGLVASLARPGGSLTGITALSTELAGKRLELLAGVRPGITRVAVLANDRHPGRRIEHDATELAAKRLGVALKYFPVVAAADFEPAFAAIAQDGAKAVLAFPDTLINAHARAIAEFAQKHRLPSISGWSEFALGGNLLSYGPTHREFFRLAASYVDKLLRGAKAADLPVEQPARFELVVNRQAAKAMALNLPQALLLRADRVIE